MKNSTARAAPFIFGSASTITDFSDANGMQGIIVSLRRTEQAAGRVAELQTNCGF